MCHLGIEDMPNSFLRDPFGIDYSYLHIQKQVKKVIFITSGNISREGSCLEQRTFDILSGRYLELLIPKDSVTTGFFFSIRSLKLVERTGQIWKA